MEVKNSFFLPAFLVLPLAFNIELYDVLHFDTWHARRRTVEKENDWKRSEANSEKTILRGGVGTMA